VALGFALKRVIDSLQYRNTDPQS